MKMCLSVISPDTTKVVWDEYFINKRQKTAGNASKLAECFFKYISIKMGAC